MSSFSDMLEVRATHAAAAILFLLLCLLAWPTAARGQENLVSPPVPLQWPRIERGQRPNRNFPIRLLRVSLEDGVNTMLCKQLMKEADEPIPADFTFSLCPAEFRNTIALRQGKVRWAPGAKPSECGTNCVHRPFMTTSSAFDKPNTNFAMLFGHLDLLVTAKTLFTRRVSFGYEAKFECITKPGDKEGVFTVRVVFDRPVVGGGGVFESVINFLYTGLSLRRDYFRHSSSSWSVR